MNKISKIFLILIFLNISCTDEKTDCYIKKREKINKTGFVFANCEAALFSLIITKAKFPETTIGQDDNPVTNILIVGCLADYSVYRDCKNKSQVKPVFGTSDGYE
jgi:hypothetical protein